MNNLLKEEAIKHGDRLQIVSVEHLQDLKKEFEQLKQQQELNGFQKWIIDDLYKFSVPEIEFEVKSIVIVAVHHPFYAEVEFMYQGKSYTTRSLVHSDAEGTKKYINEYLTSCGYHSLCYEGWNFPLKRLAVQCGLAVYGRNNITYVEGLGSSFGYMTFLTDMTCEKDEWRAVTNAELCDKCDICRKACPTGAILQDRFLINNEICLSAINESGGDFPEWLPAEVHHTIYDCLRCQERCPMNSAVSKNKIGPFLFNEEETEKLLAGNGPEDFPEEFRKRAEIIGMFDWKDGLPRNIRAIMELQRVE